MGSQFIKEERGVRRYSQLLLSEVYVQNFNKQILFLFFFGNGEEVFNCETASFAYQLSLEPMEDAAPPK